jgi:hypothetical protein
LREIVHLRAVTGKPHDEIFVTASRVRRADHARGAVDREVHAGSSTHAATIAMIATNDSTAIAP